MRRATGGKSVRRMGSECGKIPDRARRAPPSLGSCRQRSCDQTPTRMRWTPDTGAAGAGQYLAPTARRIFNLRDVTMNSFLDRREAGRMLAARLSEYARRSDAIILALPRGGIPVAYEIARALSLPLDVLLVRKVYEPGRDDVQVGTITSGGYEVLDAETIAARGVDRHVVDREMARGRQDLAYQERVYRG